MQGWYVADVGSPFRHFGSESADTEKPARLVLPVAAAGPPDLQPDGDLEGV